MWEFMLGLAFGIIVCEVFEKYTQKAKDKIKKVENDILVEELNKLKEQIEKQN
jgi:uncharacterized membrane-anchored protein YhcB (DUF1043 family)